MTTQELIKSNIKDLMKTMDKVGESLKSWLPQAHHNIITMLKTQPQETLKVIRLARIEYLEKSK